MTYDKEYIFLKNCLKAHNIAYNVYNAEQKYQNIDDLGLRYTLRLPAQNLKYIQKLFQQNIRERTICYFTDEFSCHYIAILLPETSPRELFVVGPYITRDEIEHIVEFISHEQLSPPWMDTLKNYYFKICSLNNEEPLTILVNTFADCIWGEDNHQTNYFMNGLEKHLVSFTTSLDPLKRIDLSSTIEMVERLYTSENELANAVSCGQFLKARTIFNNIPLNEFKYELEPLRNLKNFSIITNTILRKATEQGGVHPIYIDQISASFMMRIENMNRSDNVFDLWNDMIQKYCSLVNTHTTRNYSLPVQKVITRINYDIAADLSLNATASLLNINPSYLSALFKKETGYTLTDYVNKKRMEHAAFLLANTVLPVSTIATQCGILDDNYFTRLFKRQYQMTPTQFRNSICRNISI